MFTLFCLCLFSYSWFVPCPILDLFLCQMVQEDTLKFLPENWLNAFSISISMPVMWICQLNIVLIFQTPTKYREEMGSTNSLQSFATKFSIWPSSLIKRYKINYADWLESVDLCEKKFLEEGLGLVFCRTERVFYILAKRKWAGGYLHTWYSKEKCFLCSIFGCRNLECSSLGLSSF